MAKTKQLKILEEIYEELNESKKPFALKLCEELVFISSNLEELKKCIKERGAVFTTINGNGFEVVMENPAQKAYNNMIKNFLATIKQLADLSDETPQKKTIKSKLQLLRDDTG